MCPHPVYQKFYLQINSRFMLKSQYADFVNISTNKVSTNKQIYVNIRQVAQAKDKMRSVSCIQELSYELHKSFMLLSGVFSSQTQSILHDEMEQFFLYDSNKKPGDCTALTTDSYKFDFCNSHTLIGDSQYFRYVALTSGSVTAPHVAIGGTFDRLHNGHRLLLSLASVLAGRTGKITVGVTKGNEERKKLSAMIQDYEERVEAVRNFLSFACSKENEVIFAELHDRFGPVATERDISVLLLTDETGGLDTCNEISLIRSKKSLPPLNYFIVDSMVGGNYTNNDKLSSSQLRENELGVVVKNKIGRRENNENYYVIGVSGGIASGKSSVCKKLLGMADGTNFVFEHIDCDRLAQNAYIKDKDAYCEIVAQFGDVLTVIGEIDRKKLANIVFSDYKKLDKLNQIVWKYVPGMIAEEIALRLKENNKNNKKVIFFVEAALLFEASEVNKEWADMFDETWYVLSDKNTALRRIQSRNNVDVEAATRVYDAMHRLMTERQKARAANVLLTTYVDHEDTRRLLLAAVDKLVERL